MLQAVPAMCSTQGRAQAGGEVAFGSGTATVFAVPDGCVQGEPPGEGGVTAVLSVICTYSRFIYLRGITSVDAQACAEALVDVFLDMGVIPMIVQSDQGPEYERTNVGREFIIGLPAGVQQ